MDVAGEKNTLKFYENKMPYKAKQFNRIFPLGSYFKDMIGDKKEVWIADLGAGMFSTTGSTWPTAIVHIYPSDLLAEEFNEMLANKNVHPIIPVEKQDMEHLTYEDNFFDIVHCVNALDHCNSTMDAIKEMYRVCKPGGWIYLKHQRNNGDFQNFKGMHHWNISKEGEDCRFTSKYTSFLLSDFIKGFTTLEKKVDNLPYIISRAIK